MKSTFIFTLNLLSYLQDLKVGGIINSSLKLVKVRGKKFKPWVMMGLMLFGNLVYCQSLSLPVVVHVIYTDNPATNVSDLQIDSALIALNNDFRKVTGTQGDGNGVDTEIEFCLAQRDPEGNATNGINRVNCDGSCALNYESIGFSKEVNEAEVKNLSIWPTKDYYNIWIVWQFSGSLSGESGYTVGCEGYESLNGSVILYNAFGIGTSFSVLDSDTDKNRTITHEAGHWLNLLNTYEDDVNGTTCPTSSDCYHTGDKCCDTPPHIRSNNTCIPNTTCGGSAPIKNYMDNSTEECKSEFTQDQKYRMNDAFETCRLCNKISLGCQEPCNEIIAMYETGYPSGNIPISIFFNNSSTSAYKIEGYKWYVDCNLVGTDEDLIYTFNNYSNYEVCLDAYNSEGCIVRHCKTISITPLLEECTTSCGQPCLTIIPNGDFETLIGIPALPGTPACHDLGVIDEWEEALPYTNPDPYYCNFPNNTYVGDLVQYIGPNQYKYAIVNENTLLLNQFDKYEICFNYSVQRHNTSVADLNTMNVKSHIVKATPSSTLGFDGYVDEILIPNADYNAPSSYGSIGNTPYYCFEDMEFYSYKQIINAWFWAYEPINPSGYVESLFYGTKNTSGSDYVFFDNIVINKCPDLCSGALRLVSSNEECKVDFSFDISGGEATECETYTIDFGDGSEFETGSAFNHEYNWEGEFVITVYRKCGTETKVYTYKIIVDSEEECKGCDEITNITKNAYKCNNDKYISTFNIPIPSGYKPCNENGQMITSQEGNTQVNSYIINPTTNIMTVSLNITPDNPDYSDPISAYLRLCNGNGNTICYKLVSAFTGKKCTSCEPPPLSPGTAVCDERDANGYGVYTGTISYTPPNGYSLCDYSFSEAGVSATQAGNTVNYNITTTKEYPFSTTGLLVYCLGELRICVKVEIKIPILCPIEEKDKRISSNQTEIPQSVSSRPFNILNLDNQELEIEINNQFENAEIILNNLTGQVVYREILLNQKTNKFNISNLLNGLYLVSIFIDNKNIYSDKIIIFR